MSNYRADHFQPPMVNAALEVASLAGFTRSCLPEAGRILHLLASMYPDGCIGELGTGCGVGTAWIASALGPGAHLYTIDHNLELVNFASPIFQDCPNVTLLHGNWDRLTAYAPFDLLFVDVSEPKQTLPDILFQSLKVGGILVVDDMTPEEAKSVELRREPDSVRERLLNGTDLAAVEIRLKPTAAMIVAVRRYASP